MMEELDKINKNEENKSYRKGRILRDEENYRPLATPMVEETSAIEKIA